MKLQFFLIICALTSSSCVQAESVTDLKSWTLEGGVTMDDSKAGPGGGPSIRIDPKGKAVLKLRDSDGSGKVSFFVYDDGKVAMAEKQFSVGPRWGMTAKDGRVLAGAIMYHPKLHPTGSLCLFDTNPADKNAWRPFKYLAPRGAPGWKKWEFDYNPEKGLAISVDGKPVTEKYFNWNYSKAAAFNGLVFYGDDTEGTPQTIWVSGLNYELGPPMKVTPGSLPAPPLPPVAVPKGPAPEEETEKTKSPILGKMNGFIPGATLLDDLKDLKIPLVPGYAAGHPRLLFSANDRVALQKKAQDQPELWNRVLADAKSIKSPESVPDPMAIQSGAKYFRIPKVESAALAWFVTGEKEYKESATRWMIAHCKEGVWGNTYRPNLDLVASYYLYHIAIAYDILKDELRPEDRKLIADGLTQHARAIYLGFDPYNTSEKLRYDQNHTYIPTVALCAASLALLEDVPEAKFWLTRSYALLRRSRYVQSEDGYYYEGFGYWTYALHWHVRGAELLGRATDEKLFDLPVLRDSWLCGLHLSLPGSPRAFDIGDTNSWKDSKRVNMATTNASMLWGIASHTGSGESRLVGDLYDSSQPEKDFPASAFLWFSADVKPAALDQVQPFHYFPDHDVVTWRSSWKDDATCYLFRSGPPLGHKAKDKLSELKDWTMNGGHVHPDIGAFWIYAKGAYLAVGTGYTAEKWTKDHNTLLVDGKGQGVDGSYNNERGVPYQDLDQAHINSQFLSPAYGYVSGEFGQTYKRQVPGVKLRRRLLMTERWMLVVDDMDGDKEHQLTWVCHSDAPFALEGSAYVARQPQASLAVLPLLPTGLDSKMEETTVMAGKAPGRGTPEKRGFHLHLTTSQPSKTTRIINLLVPLGQGEKLPIVQLKSQDQKLVVFSIKWPSGKTEDVQLNTEWKASSEPSSSSTGPAIISTK